MSSSGLFADSLDPFIPTRRRITCPARFAAFEAARVNIFASAKLGSEEGDFGLGGGMLVNSTGSQVRKSNSCVHPILHLPFPGALATIKNRPGEVSTVSSRKE
jgi:hypothetical protein